MLVGCGATVVSDYVSKTDFSKYQSYNFYPSIDSGLNSLDEKRIKNSIDSVMAVKGITKDSTADVLINFYAEERLEDARNVIGIGVGSGGGNVGVGVSGGIPIGGKEWVQLLTLDFVDAEEDQLIWQGVLEGRYKERATPLQKTKYYRKQIEKILRRYPPKK